VRKKSFIALLFVFTLLIGNAFSANSALAGDSVQSLKKQVTQLQVQVKALTSKLKAKDQEIAKLKKENATLKTNAATISKTKVSYNGLVKTGVITYKSSEYIPVSFVKDVLEIPVTYDRKADINYVGVKPNGMFMSDIMKPYYSSNSFSFNTKMVMGQDSYYKGFQFSFYDGYEINFNLNKKYKNLSGKIGLDDNQSSSWEIDTKVQVLGDGELLGEYVIKSGDLPIDINLDIVNVTKLQFEFSDPGLGRPTVDLVDLIIK
jgi:cell division protein FtsB